MRIDFWRRQQPPEPKKLNWRLVTATDGKPIWVNLRNVSNMIGSVGDVDTTILFLNDDKFIEVLETPSYILSEAAELASRAAIEEEPHDDEEG